MIKLYKVHQTGKVGWWSIEVCTKATGEVALQTLSAGSKEAKPVESMSPVVGKNIGRANETTPYEQAVLEMNSKANKKRDGGYVDVEPADGSSVTNALGFIRPQKAQPYKDMSDRQLDAIDWENAYVQRKLDGHRAMVKEGQMYSSSGKPINMPHITDSLKNITEHLDGELYLHGVRLQDISKLVKKHRPGETERLEYHVFDTVSDKPFSDRYREFYLRKDTALNIVKVHTYKVSSLEEVLAYHKRFLAEGYEGAMLRQGTNGYKGGARAADIIKFKEMEDAEYEIIGVVEAKKKLYQGVMLRQSRFVCKDIKAGKTFKVLAHGAVPEKGTPIAYPARYIGKMLTVQFFGLTADGLPNLPVAKCLREDL